MMQLQPGDRVGPETNLTGMGRVWLSGKYERLPCPAATITRVEVIGSRTVYTIRPDGPVAYEAALNEFRNKI